MQFDNLYNLYTNDPRNYIVESQRGGTGKTVGLKAFSMTINEGNTELNGRKCIAFYLSMSHLNTVQVMPGIILRSIAELYYPNDNMYAAEQSIKTMIDNYKNDYQFIFVLDGFNEVRDYRTMGNQTARQVILLDILNILCYKDSKDEYINRKNVNIIVSVRLGKDFRKEMVPELRNQFDLIRIHELKQEQIDKYIGNLHQDYLIEKDLVEIINNPLMLRMFKQVLSYNKAQHMELKITSKLDLLDEFYHIEMVKKLGNDEYAERIYGELIPILAYKKELRLLNQDSALIDYPQLFNEIIDATLSQWNEGTMYTYYRDTVVTDVLKSGIVTETMEFTHDIVREYFASIYIYKLASANICTSKEIEEFFSLLNRHLYYDIKKNIVELQRRTQFFDMAELVVLKYQKEHIKLEKVLSKIGITDNKAVLLTEQLYQQVAGVYDDLGYRNQESDMAMIASTYMPLIEEMGYMTNAELAINLKFLFYCINKRPSVEGMDGSHINVLLRAMEIMEKELEREPNNSFYMREYGKMLSNRGAFYYGPFYNAEDKYERCLESHYAALNYRKSHNLSEKTNDHEIEVDNKRSVLESYRTIVADYRALKDYRKAYMVLVEAIEYAYGKNRLSESIDNIDMQPNDVLFKDDFLVIAFAIEAHLLLNDTDFKNKEIKKEFEFLAMYLLNSSVKAGVRHMNEANIKTMLDIFNLDGLNEIFKEKIAMWKDKLGNREV